MTRVEIWTRVDPIPDDELGNSQKIRLRCERALMASGLLQPTGVRPREPDESVHRHPVLR
jgi:hypothetical protein